MRITIGGVAGILILAAAVAGLVWAVVPDPAVVETATVAKGRFVATVEEDGKARIRERYVVAAPLAGRLARVPFKVGDRVAAGQTISVIMPSYAPLLDPRSRREAEERLGAAQAAMERVRATVERGQAEAGQAQRELARTRTLVERGAASAQALERAELAMRVADRDLRAAAFQRDAAEHEYAQAKALLARYEQPAEGPAETWSITAPVAGVLLKVTQESETTIQPGAAIVEIGDPRDLEIVVDVLSTDAVEIRPDAAVTIVNWGGPTALRGRVRRVEPAAFTKVSTLGVEEQRVNIRIDLVSPPDDWSGLGDGYQVDAQIVVFARDDAIILPTGALFRRGDTWTVFVVVDGRAEARAVTLVRRSGRVAAIAGGVEPGDRVIVYPSDRITAGLRVRVR